jgi:hypothetical protein
VIALITSFSYLSPHELGRTGQYQNQNQDGIAKPYTRSIQGGYPLARESLKVVCLVLLKVALEGSLYYFDWVVAFINFVFVVSLFLSPVIKVLKGPLL